VEYVVDDDHDDRSAWRPNAKEQLYDIERFVVERLHVDKPALATGAKRRRLREGRV
jgi:hypothetical protein